MTRSLGCLLSFLFLLSIVGLSSSQKPEVTVTRFHNLPSRLYYFDDTTVVLYHDSVEGNIHISEDEGKHWKVVDDIPKGEALILMEHPFENRYAFVLTRKSKHYRTIDRGKTWQSFEMPDPPALTSAPLSFHAGKTKFESILYQGRHCKSNFPWATSCDDKTYYTLDAFATSKPLLDSTSKCHWAHGTKEFPTTTPENLILCVAFDQATTDGSHSLESSRLFSSQDFFDKDKTLVDFGLGKQGRGVVALGIMSKFIVAALKDMTGGGSSNSEMLLYVSVDGFHWSKAKFPHGSNSKLLENAYTIVESTTHSLAVDVLSHSASAVGTLFVSNSNGTYFAESLKNTNRNNAGFVDFEDIVGVDGVGLANVVANADEVDGRHAEKKIKSVITFDDGRTWSPLKPPSKDVHGDDVHCNTNDPDKCSLHLYSVTTPHNFGRVFSTPAPGFAMGVGSVGEFLKPYDDCDTFLSTDAGLTWTMVHKDAAKYEFGDQGSIIIIVNDEEATDKVRYSYDDGKTWQKIELDIKLRARLITTIPDSTSQKFILVGTTTNKDSSEGRHAVVFLDFATLGKRKCEDKDFEKWYARTAKGKECLMGHKQWYNRRKADADCYVGDKFHDPEEHEDNCTCEEEDYECDYNFVRQGDQCVAAGPEPIPEGVCPGNHETEKYTGSSGYRLIPGNTCKKEGGVVLDKPITKDCSLAQPPEGNATHQTFEFNEQVIGHWYFRNSQTILVHLADGSVWQSGNEGYSWARPRPKDNHLAIYIHSFSDDRAYLIGYDKMAVTTDGGRLWTDLDLPMRPNVMGLPILHFHPLQSDWLIYIGAESCTKQNDPCKAVALYSTDHGRKWHRIEEYVRSCDWARDKDLKIDKELILCESYRDKKGSQLAFNGMNPLELWIGSNFFSKKVKLFDRIVGHTKFSEYLIVASMSKDSLDLQVSLDGRHYAKGLFPPNMQVDNHAYTVLESSTDSVFLHLTMSSTQNAEWGNLLKSNSNGTYYGLSLEYANRNDKGYVDFEKMIGLDGIAVMNVVSNPDTAAVKGKKDLQTRITHNDGGTWKPMAPPAHDSLGQKYKCSGAQCSLHIHGYTERIDSRATYSSPSAIGLMMAVGNVGEKLAPYTESDTFLTRDGGFTWEEIRKDAHMYEFGDSGSILVIANDEAPTDFVLFSTNEGLTWTDYKIGQMVRVRSIVTVTAETSRKFILFGALGNGKSVAIHLDFSAITKRKCSLKMDDSANDDFELWSPSEEREEKCLFGRQVLYHRRIRDRNCYVGDQVKDVADVRRNCQCTASDFECEFNHIRNSAGECVLTEGAIALSTNTEETCITDPESEYWYERTAYRKIPYSSCEGGERPDRGTRHSCGGVRGHSSLFWWSIILLPFAFTALVGYSYYRKGAFGSGSIRLPDTSSRDARGGYGSDSGVLDTIASIPWFVIGVGASAYAYVVSLPLWDGLRPRTGYRHVAVDEDARVLRFEDDD